MLTQTASTIDGRELAHRLRDEIAVEVARQLGHGCAAPGLATILVGEDHASAAYVASKHRAAAGVGLASFPHHLDQRVAADELLSLIDRLNEDPAVSGILCQLPLPEHLDAAAIIDRITPAKDVDGLTSASVARLAGRRPGLRPCTPAGVIRLLAHTGFAVAGARAVVIGRSGLVGAPMAQMLLNADATVTVCHSKTPELGELCSTADLVVAAAGHARLVQADWIRRGATVIDVGINRDDDGRLCGDVDFDAVRQVAAAITPVPGGVGPMTIACLLANTLQAAQPQDQPRADSTRSDHARVQ